VTVQSVSRLLSARLLLNFLRQHLTIINRSTTGTRIQATNTHIHSSTYKGVSTGAIRRNPANHPIQSTAQPAGAVHDASVLYQQFGEVQQGRGSAQTCSKGTQHCFSSPGRACRPGFSCTVGRVLPDPTGVTRAGASARIGEGGAQGCRCRQGRRVSMPPTTLVAVNLLDKRARSGCKLSVSRGGRRACAQSSASARKLFARR